MVRFFQHRPARSDFLRFAAASLAALVLNPARAQPADGKVTKGSATIQRNGNTTTITAANNTIIRYNNFDIAADQTVQFIQPSSTAKVLNWVTSSLPTHIDGSLFANGQVYIGNAAGIYFGAHAYVNVGALYAAGGTISSNDFLKGANHFTDLTGVVSNAGTIEAQSAALIGDLVANHGSIHAPNGFVTLAAGRDVFLSEPGSAIIVSASTAQKKIGTAVENTGSIDVGHGRALLAAGDMYSVAISQSGVVRGEHLVLDGQGGVTRVSGTLDASGTTASEHGGEIHVLGKKIALAASAHLEASGATGGGTILVGGDYQGNNPAIADAEDVRIQAGATLNADARTNGSGGRVIVWSNQSTDFAGQISARGGATGGNGGFAEVSSGNWLNYNGLADLRAPRGNWGNLLLDPHDITINSSSNNPVTSSDIQFTDTPGVDSTFGTAELVNQLKLGNVTLRANNDITVAGAVDSSANPLAGDLTLQAGRTITINADITLNGGFSATANDSNANPLNRDAGSGSIVMGSRATITAANNSPISLTVDGITGAGTITVENLVTSGTGTVTLATASAITVNGNVTAPGGFTAQADTNGNSIGNFAQNANSTITAGTVGISAANLTLNASSSVNAGSGTITLAPSSDTRVINLGSGTGAFDVSSAALANLTAGTVIIGRSTGTGEIDSTGLDLSSLPFNLTLQGATSGGSAIVFTGDLLTKGGQTLTLDSGGAMSFGGALNTGTGGSVTLVNSGGFSVTGVLTTGTLTVPSTVQSVTLTGSGSSVANAVTFNSPSLTIGGADNDTFSFSGGLTSDATTNTFRGTLTTGNQPLSLGSQALTLAGSTTLNAGTSTLALGAVTGNTSNLTLTGSGVTLNGNLVGLAALLVNGATTFAGTTVGADSIDFANTLTLGAATSLTATNALTLNGVAGGTENLTLTGGSIALDGNLSNLGALQVNDAVTFSAASIGGDSLTFSGTLTLAAPATFTATNGLTLSAVTGAAQDLTLNGSTVRLNGDLTNLGTLQVTGPTTLAGSSIDGAGITFANTLTLSGSTAITSTHDLTLAAVTAGTSQLTLTADLLTLNGDVTGTGDYFIQPASIGRSILIGAVDATQLSLANAALAHLKTTGTVTLGQSAGTGDITDVSALDLHLTGYNLTLRGASSALSFADLTLAPGKTLSLNSAGAMTFSGLVNVGTSGTVAIAQTGGLEIDGALTSGTLTVPSGTYSIALKGSGTTITNAVTFANSALTLGNTDADTITFAGGLNSSATTNTFRGTIGTTNQPISVGALTLAGNLSIDAGTAALGLGAVTGNSDNITLTSGGTTFNGALTSLANFSATGPANLGSHSLSAANITFNGALTVSGASSSLSAGNTLTLAGLAAGSTAVTLEGTEINFTGGANSLVGTGALVLQPSSATTAITLGRTTDSSNSVLDLTTSDLSALQNGFQNITIGRSDGTGAITATGALSFQDPLTLRGDPTTSSFALTGTLAGTDNASLTLATANASLTAAGLSTVNHNITLQGATTLASGPQTIDAGTGTVSIGSLQAGNVPLTITAGSVNFTGGGGSIVGSSTLALRPSAANSTIGIGGGSSGTFNLSTNDLAAFAAGFSGLTIGRTDGTGAIDLRGSTWSSPVTFETSTGPIQLQGSFSTVAGNAGHAFTVDAPGGATLAGTTVISTAGTGASGNIHFTGAITGAQALTLDAGGATVNLDSTVGSSGTPLTLLSLTSGHNLSQSAPWSVQNLSVSSSGGNINLSNPANAFSGTVTLTSTANTVATITTTTPLTFGDVQLGVGGSALNATANGTLQQTAGSTIDVAGATTFTVGAAGSNLLLGNPTNTFNGAFTAGVTGPGSILALALGNASLAAAVPTLPSSLQTLDINFPNTSVTLPTLNLTGNLSVTVGGAITGLSAVSVAGSTILQAGASSTINLSNSGNSLPTVSIGGANDVLVQTSGPITFGNSAINGNLVVEAGSTISESGTLTVPGDAFFFTNGSDLTLNKNNTFGTVILGSSGNVNLVNTQGLILGRATAFTTFDSLNVTAESGAIGQVGSGGTISVASQPFSWVTGLSVLGTTQLHANGTGGGIALGDSGNAFADVITFDTVGDAQIYGSPALSFGVGIANGAVDLSASQLTLTESMSGGAGVTLSGIVVLSKAGDQTIDGGTGTLVTNGSLTKTGSGNLFLLGQAIHLNNNVGAVAGLQLTGTTTLNGDLSAQGLILDSLVLSGSGTQTIDALNGSLLIQGTLTKASGRLSLSGNGGIDLENTTSLPGGTLTFNNAATVGGDLTAKGISFASTLTLNRAGAQALDATTGPLTITGALTKTTGDLTLSGNSLTLSGATDTLGAGQLTLNNPAHVAGNVSSVGLIFTGDITLNGGAAQTLNAHAGAISASGKMTKATGDLTLSGSSGIGVSGDLVAANGNLSVTDALTEGGNVKGASITLSKGAIFNGVGAQALDAFTNALTVTGDLQKPTNGGLSLIGTSGITLAGSTAQTLDGGAGQLLLNGAVTRSGASSLTLLSGVSGVKLLNSLSTGGALTVANALTAAGNISSNGLTLSGATTLNGAGTQKLDAGTGGILASGTIDKASGDLELTGQVGINLRATTTVTSGALQLDQAATVGANIYAQGLTFFGTTTLDGPTAQTLSGGTGALSFTGNLNKSGVGDLTLSGAGGITTNQNATVVTGELIASDPLLAKGNVSGSLGLAFAQNVSLAGSGLQTLNAGAGTLVAGGDVAKTTAGNLTIVGAANFNGSGNQALSVANGTLSINNGAGAFAKTSAGSFSLSGNAVTVTGSLAALEALKVSGPLTLVGDVNAADQTFANNVTLTGTGLQTLTASTGSLTFGGALVKPAGALSLNAGDEVVLGGLTTISAGSAALTGHVLLLDQFAAQTATFANDVSAIGAGPQSIDGGAGSLTFGGNLTKSTPGGLSLSATAGIFLSGDATSSGGLTFANAAVLTSAGSQTLDAGAGTLTANGTLTKTVSGDVILNGSAIVLNQNVSAVAGIQLNGPTSLAGNLSAQGLTLDSLLLNGSGPQELDAGLGVLLVQGTLTKNSSNLVLAGAAGINLRNDTTLPNGSITFDNDATLGGSLSAQGLSFAQGLTLDGATGQTLNAGSSPLLITGVISKASGDLTLVSASNITLLGNVDLTAGQISFSNTTAIGGDVFANGIIFDTPVTLNGATDQTLDAGSGSLLAAGPLGKVTAGALTLRGQNGIFVQGDLSTTNGALRVGDPLNVSGNINADGIALADTILAGAGVQTVNARNGALGFTGALSKATGDLILDAAGGITATGSINVTAGALTFANAATLGADGSAHGINFLDTVTLNGNLDQTLDANNQSLNVANALTKTGTGNLTLKGQAGLSLTGDVTVAAGSLTMADQFISQGNLTAIGLNFDGTATFSKGGAQSANAGAGDLHALGSVIKTGAGDLSLSGTTIHLDQDVHAVASVQFNGTTTLAGNLSATGLTLDSIDLSGSGLQTIDAGSGALLIQGALTKLSGDLVLQAVSGINVRNSTTLPTGSLTFSNQATIGGDLDAQGLRFDGAVTLDGTGTQSLNAETNALTFASTVTKSGAGDLLLSAATGISLGDNLAVNAGGLRTNNVVTANGNLSALGMTLVGDVTLSRNGSQTIDAGTGALEADGAISKTVAGDLTLKGAALQLNGSVNAVAQVTFVGPTSLGGDLTAQGLAIDALTLSGLGTQRLNAGNGQLSILGALDKAAGDLILAGTAGITIADTVTVDAGSLTVADAATVSGNVNAQAIAFSHNTSFVSNQSQQVNAGTGALQFGGLVTRVGTGTLTLIGSTINLSSALNASQAAVTFTGPAQLAANVTAVGLDFQNTISLLATGAQTLDAGAGLLITSGSLTKTSGDLVLGGLAGVLIEGDVTAADSLSVHGPLTLNGNAFADGISFAGAHLNGGAQTIDAGTGLLNSTASILKTSSGALTLEGRGVQVAGDIQTPDTLLVGSPTTFSGNVIANGVTFAGNVTLTGGTQTIDAGTGQLQSSAVQITKSGGLLRLAGSSGQLGSIDVGSTGTIADNVFVSALTGTWNAGTIQFAHGFSIAGDTTFNSRVSLGSSLDTGGFKVIFGGDVTLTQDIAINTGSGALSFDGNVNGADSLILTIGNAGRVSFSSAVGNTSPLTHLETQGLGSLYVGADVTTNGPTQLYGTSVFLTHDAVLTELNSVGGISFANTLDSAPGSSAGLTLNTPGVVRFDADVGSQAPLSWLKIGAAGTTVLNVGSVTTTGAQTYGADLTLGRSARLTTDDADLDFANIEGQQQNLIIGAPSGAGAIHFHGDVNHLGTGLGAALLVEAGETGKVTFDGVLTANSGLSLTNAAPVVFQKNVTLSGGDTDTQLGGNVQLGQLAFSSTRALTFGSLTLTAGPVSIGAANAQAIHIVGDVEGAAELSLNTTGNTVIDGNIGSTKALIGFTTDAGGTTTLNGNIHTTGAQNYHDSLILAGGGDQSLTSDLDAILASGTVQKNGRGNLTLHAGGPLTLQGDTTVEQGSLQLNASATTADGNLSAQGITLANPLTLAGPTAQTIDAQQGQLAIAGVTKTTGALTLKGTNAELAGDLTTSSADLTLEFSSVALTHDMALSSGSGAGNISVTGAITGAFALDLKAGSGAITMKGALGTRANALKSLSADGGTLSFNDVYTEGDQSYGFDATGVLLLNGNVYAADQGSLLFNTSRAPRTAIPVAATIAKPTAGNLLLSAGKNITFGLYEKASVVNGSLTVAAKQNVTVSDLSVAGALTIDAAGITLLTRPASTVQTQNGSATDLGLDFVARTIDFFGPDGLTQIPGAALTFYQGTAQRNFRVRFATESGQAGVPPLPGFSFYRLPTDIFANEDISQVTFGPFDNVYLDLRAIGYNRANVGSALPPIAPNQVAIVAPKVEVSAALRDDLVKLGIFARPDTELALQPVHAGAQIYDGIIKSEERSPELFEVADTRISSEEALKAIRLYRQVFEARTPEGTVRNRVSEIQIHFTDAFQAYQQATGQRDAAGFRRWLTTQNGPLISDLNALRSLLLQIGRLGLTEEEFSISKTYVLRSIRVPGLPLHNLREVIEAEPTPSGNLLTSIDPHSGPKLHDFR